MKKITELYTTKEIRDMCGISESGLSKIKSEGTYRYFSIAQALKIHLATQIPLNEIEPHYSEVWGLIENVNALKVI